MSRKKTDGVYSHDDEVKLFLAGNISSIKSSIENSMITSLLMPVDSFREKEIPQVLKYTETCSVFIDSGIHSLTQRLQDKYFMTPYKSLLVKPTEVPGYDKLFKLYVSTLEKIKDKIWGYAELDLGGAEEKRNTRYMLENEYGLNPIPVYHPFIDPYEYFDELASEYERICIGNIAYATQEERERLFYTISERKQKYNPLWVHTLGSSLNPELFALDIQSTDSSTWLAVVRWGSVKSIGGAEVVSLLGREYVYSRKSSNRQEQYRKSQQLSAYEYLVWQDNWRTFKKETGRLKKKPCLNMTKV